MGKDDTSKRIYLNSDMIKYIDGIDVYLIDGDVLKIEKGIDNGRFWGYIDKQAKQLADLLAKK